MTTADYLNQLETDRQTLITNLETMGITGLTGDETFTELVPKVLEISAGADLGDYFTKTIRYSSNPYSRLYQQIKRIPSDTVLQPIDQSFANCFYGCSSLIEVPLLDTSNINWMPSVFYNCTALTTVPVFDTHLVVNMENMFYGCPNLTDTSLDNILQMCINATPYNRTKTLTAIGVRNYDSARIQALPHYNAFISAGWNI